MVEFLLSMHAFSINAASYRDNRFKTAEYKAWHQEICARIAELDNYKELLDLADAFKANGGVFKIWIAVLYPPHVFRNKSGQISAKTFDVTNTEKLLLDVIFRDTLQLDDRFVVRCVSSKRAAATYGIEVKLELVPDNYT